ncbi:MAG TPA: hypothetical protein VN721_09545 [Flavipsychrobacter sp.]|nr:hypothetical protein [Flavipsychrobacter sp.]
MNTHLQPTTILTKQAISVSNNANTAANGSKESELTNDKLELTRLKTLLVNTKAKLEVENNELTRVEQFHIGRLKNTREQEIRTQDLRIQAYQDYVQRIQGAIINKQEQINALENELAQAKQTKYIYIMKL